MLLSVLIPAYQEEATVGLVLERLLAVDIESMGFQKEIICCDDGSTDDTVGMVMRAAANDDRIILLRHDKNRGKGAAIRTALEAARGRYALIQDADLEYEVSDYPVLLAPLLDGAQVVFGSRFLHAKHPEKMRRANLLGNRVLTLAANVLFGMSITDEATCLKLFETRLLRSLNLQCEGFEFCPEVTAKLGLRRVRVVEVPVRYTARNLEEGKKVCWIDGVKALWTLCVHRLKGK